VGNRGSVRNDECGAFAAPFGFGIVAARPCVSRSLSPIVLMTRPPNSPTIRAPSCAWRSTIANPAVSPYLSKYSVEATTSVKRTATLDLCSRRIFARYFTGIQTKDCQSAGGVYAQVFQSIFASSGGVKLRPSIRLKVSISALRMFDFGPAMQRTALPKNDFDRFENQDERQVYSED
jgi:hypothetical protein